MLKEKKSDESTRNPKENIIRKWRNFRESVNCCKQPPASSFAGNCFADFAPAAVPPLSDLF
jgi:hypothetical protein